MGYQPILRMPGAAAPAFNEPDLRAFLAHTFDPEAGVMELFTKGAGYVKANVIAPIEQYGRQMSGWYDDADALVRDASYIRGVSCYLVPNPIRRDLLALANNKIRAIKNRTDDDDVALLRWAFLDIDPVKPKKDMSSSDAELQATVDRRDAILSDNPEWADGSIWGRSGNGSWILVRLPDWPNDEEHRKLLVRFGHKVGEKYTDNVAKVDPSTTNPARLVPCPGTLKCKGDPIPGRPHRLATLDRRTA